MYDQLEHDQWMTPKAYPQKYLESLVNGIQMHDAFTFSTAASALLINLGITRSKCKPIVRSIYKYLFTFCHWPVNVSKWCFWWQHLDEDALINLHLLLSFGIFIFIFFFTGIYNCLITVLLNCNWVAKMLVTKH